MVWWWLAFGTAAAADPAGGSTRPGDADPHPPTEPLPSDPGAPFDPVTAPFTEVLAGAKQHWFEGRAELAREWLATLHGRVVHGEVVPGPEVAEALTWLGEVQYLDGDPDAARLTFLDLLQREPDAEISPYHHPTEVVNLFDLVRTEVRARNTPPPPPPPPPRPPAPVWVLAPFGIPQFGQGRTGAGFTSAGIQVALGAASIGTYAVLRNRWNDDDQPGIPLDSPRERTVERWRYRAQWPATFAFYGAWALGSWEAARHHRRTWVPTVAVDAGTPTVGVRIPL